MPDQPPSPAAIDPAAIDPSHFRRVLGQYPTGVVVISAIGADSKPVGMAVGSFTSVSLNPPPSPSPPATET